MEKKVVFCHTAHPRLNLIGQIQLDILLDLIKAGNEVYVLKASDELVKSQTNYITPDFMVYHYHKLYEKTVAILKKEGTIFELSYSNSTNHKTNYGIPNISDLKKLRYKDVQIGMGVASSLISLIRDHELDTNLFKKEIDRELRNATNIVETFINIKNQIGPELVYVFNGRMATYSPIIDFCKTNQIQYNVFEFTSRLDKYHVLNKAIPHDISYREREMMGVWSSENDENLKIKIACDFYDSQKKGKSLMEDNFISYQKQNLIPTFDEDKELITFFNSSIDEFASVPGWENYIYVFEDESSAICKICKHFAHDKKKQFILRIHPNLKFLKNSQILKLQSLYSLDNLIIIEALSPISSYALIEISDKVITFGSTIGIEATYFNKPSILLGMSFFDNLDVAYLPSTESEVYQLIDDFGLAPKPKVNTYKYGFWWMTFGEDFIYRDVLYSEKSLKPSNLQIGIGVLIKGFSKSLWGRVYGALNINLIRKMKNPAYRKAILREFAPWRKK
nr:hypothetical protein [uncultured Pedobacter sp.]